MNLKVLLCIFVLTYRYLCGCKILGLVSTFLTNLSIEHTYLVMVRAANEVGLGQPCPPIVVKTFENIKTDNPGEKFNGTEEVEDNRTLGKRQFLCLWIFFLLH